MSAEAVHCYGCRKDITVAVEADKPTLTINQGEDGDATVTSLNELPQTCKGVPTLLCVARNFLNTWASRKAGQN
jgi:hypothetical protein